jgi:hypothetical protein
MTSRPAKQVYVRMIMDYDTQKFDKKGHCSPEVTEEGNEYLTTENIRVFTDIET